MHLLVSEGAYTEIRLHSAITVFVDSYFWKIYPLWPEFAGIYFNVYEGKSADWGVSPVHAYFTSHIPRLLLLGAPLALFGALIDSRAREAVLPALCAVGLLSGLAHKEWRFIVYNVPLFNFAAARGARAMYVIALTTVNGH